MRTLLLNPPSFLGFDGGAGSRYQAKREITSFWYPTWLAQAAAMTPRSRVVDAPADGLSPRQVVETSRDFDLVVIYTSTPSFDVDAAIAARIKHANPRGLIGFVGPHVSVLASDSLARASAVDFVVRREFDRQVSLIAQGARLRDIEGISYRENGSVAHNDDAAPIRDLDGLPFVTHIYKRDLTIENYFVGYLMHPYVSIYTGRGCPGRCIFCLWPQTFSGRHYRTRSPQSVFAEFALARDYFPQAREFFIDDDTFTANASRAVEIARGLAALGVTWSTSSRANLNHDTLRELKENGLRLLMVGYESGSDDILKRSHKGVTAAQARQFTRDCKSLGIKLHGTFCLGLPGENRETIQQTISFAREIDPDTVQVSIASPYPGTEFHAMARDNGWLADSELVSPDGVQVCALRYPGLEPDEVTSGVERLYRSFYFRPRVIARIGWEMARDAGVRRRRLREGREFFSFLSSRRGGGDLRENAIRRVLRDGGPGFCQFAVTDACNARCKFCNFSLDTESPAGRSVVSADGARAAIDVLAENGVAYLAFVGGEPTLHPDLTGLISHARARHMSTILCTNGSLLDDDLVGKYAAAGLESVIISVDAPDVSSHEENRGLSGVCDTIKSATTDLKKRGIACTASVTMSRLLGDYSRLPGFLRSLGFDAVTFSYPLRFLDSSFRGYSDSDLIDYSSAEITDSLHRVEAMKKKIRVVNPRASLREMRRFVDREEQRFPCLAGLKYFYLDWRLDLYRCHAWREPMCHAFDLDGSRLVRDGCVRCMIDCYRDASVMHHLGMALYDARVSLLRGGVRTAVASLLNRRSLESLGSVVETMPWIRGL